MPGEKVVGILGTRVRGKAQGEKKRGIEERLKKAGEPDRGILRWETKNRKRRAIHSVEALGRSRGTQEGRSRRVVGREGRLKKP